MAAVTPMASFATLTAFAALAALALTIVVAVGNAPGDICHREIVGVSPPHSKKLASWRLT
jgi:hypothetical protein